MLILKCLQCRHHCWMPCGRLRWPPARQEASLSTLVLLRSPSQAQRCVTEPLGPDLTSCVSGKLTSVEHRTVWRSADVQGRQLDCDAKHTRVSLKAWCGAFVCTGRSGVCRGVSMFKPDRISTEFVHICRAAQHSWIHLATRPSAPCARGGPRSPTSLSW